MPSSSGHSSNTELILTDNFLVLYAILHDYTTTVTFTGYNAYAHGPHPLSECLIDLFARLLDCSSQALILLPFSEDVIEHHRLRVDQARSLSDREKVLTAAEWVAEVRTQLISWGKDDDASACLPLACMLEQVVHQLDTTDETDEEKARKAVESMKL